MTTSQMSSEDLARLYGVPASSLHTLQHEAPREGLRSVLDLARDHLGCDRAGVAVRDPQGRILTPDATDRTVEAGDRLQAAHGDGPVASGAWPSEQVALDVTSPSLWREWARGLSALGIVSVLATQLDTGVGEKGALTLYYSRHTEFTDQDRVLARVLARCAADQLTQARLVAHLSIAVERRTVIGQAQGILMERFRFDADEAFGVLRRRSQDTNTKLQRVAASLVATGELGPSRSGPTSVLQV